MRCNVKGCTREGATLEALGFCRYHSASPDEIGALRAALAGEMEARKTAERRAFVLEGEYAATWGEAS